MNRRGFLKAGLSTGAVALFPSVRLLAEDRTQPLRLNANENPLGLPFSARKAVEAAFSEANLYPFASARRLAARLSEFHSVPESTIVLGNGSSEILNIAVDLVAGPRSQVITSEPTFEQVIESAVNRSVPLQKIPLRSDFTHDLSALKARAEQSSGPALVYICNPNNPTGTLTPTKEIKEWIQSAPANLLFLVDEAYHHYVEHSSYQSLLLLAAQRENLIVSRTFSKVYAMAGMRMGYAVAGPELARRLSSLCAAPNTNSLAHRAAEACLQDEEFLTRSLATNREAKAALTEGLRGLRINYLRSETNFVMFDISGDLQLFIQRMRERSILVGRPFPPYASRCRVSLGMPEQMHHFCQILQEFRQKGWV